MRPSSHSSESNVNKKPQFQTKIKSRIRGNSVHEGLLNASSDLNNPNATFRSTESHFRNSKHRHEECEQKQDIFARTAQKLSNVNFTHHDKNGCVCQSCLCGRHLCKLHVIKPDLKKNSIYQKSFYQQKHIPNIVNCSKQYDRLQGPHLDMKSTYFNDLLGKKGDQIERPRPDDLLKSQGPAANVTSYSSGFPGHHGLNQYIKPTDKHTRGHFPLRSKSTYSNQYVKKAPKKDDYTYFPDQLKTGYDWLGKSSYSNFFDEPNPQYMAKPYKIIQKLEINPNFNHQYETVYKNDFISKPTTICPSRIDLQTKLKGQFENTKANFNENADFKAMSPDYHAISTSKHCYV